MPDSMFLSLTPLKLLKRVVFTSVEREITPGLLMKPLSGPSGSPLYMAFPPSLSCDLDDQGTTCLLLLLKLLLGLSPACCWLVACLTKLVVLGARWSCLAIFNPDECPPSPVALRGGSWVLTATELSVV